MTDLDLLVRTGLWPDGDGGSDAVVLVEDAANTRVPRPGADPVGAFVTTMLAAGMVLVLDMTHLDLPVLAGWSVTLTDTGLAVRWPAGTELVDAPVRLGDGWRRVALAAGHVTLLAGTALGLADADRFPRPVAAYRNGTLAGGIAPLTGEA